MKKRLCKDFADDGHETNNEGKNDNHYKFY